MRSAYVAGVGYTKVSEHWEKSLTELASEAALAAIRDAGVERVDAIYLANAAAEVTSHQIGISAIVSEELGLSGVPAVRIECGEASGMAAFLQAHAAVSSGLAEVALVVGAEKLSDLMPEEYNTVYTMTLPHETMGFAGITPSAIAALLYRIYMERYEVPQEFVAHFPVLMHRNAKGVPHAQFPFEVRLEDVLSSPYVAAPLRRLETTAPCDGAAALVLVSEESLGSVRSGSVTKVGGISVRTDYVSPFEREDPLFLSSVALSVEEALMRSGIDRDDVNVVELHDSFSVMAPLILESAGFSPKGKSGLRLKEGSYDLGGELPINTFGGLKARGHPFGATALYQLAELHLQLTGRAGKNQVDKARKGLAISTSGFGAISGAAVLLGGDGA